MWVTKLLTCIIAQSPVNEIEKAVMEKDEARVKSVVSEKYLAALESSRKGSTASFKSFESGIESKAPHITEKAVTKPQIESVVIVAFFTESVKQKSDA